MKHKHHATAQSWTERTQGETSPGDDISGGPRQSFQKHHSSVGAVHTHASGLGIAGHIIHMAGVFIPVVAGELIQDASKYKKTVRLASIGTALAYELAWTIKQHQREKQQEAKLAECRGRE